ncbi:MAG: HTTM domain-containing protein [Myxococcales bacterium]
MDIASLAFFRAGFGAVMCVALVRFWLKGFFAAQLVQPQFHFTYEGLSFVRPLPAPWLELSLGVLALCAACMSLGLFYRASSVLFGLGFVYLELIERSTYLNHYYLISLLCFLLACLPAADAFSLDALRKGRTAASIPAFCLWTLRAQVGVVYVFAGIAKLDADWLLHAQPLRIWLSAQRDFPLVGAWLSEPKVAFAFSWAGAAFDLFIVPALLWRRTRAWAYAALVSFHALTGLWFPIGMFPWIMMLAATLFFAPDWPRRFLRNVFPPTRRDLPDVQARKLTWLKPLFALHVLTQLAVPLYQHARGTDAAWSGRGFDFAWKVMLAERAGSVSFRVRDQQQGSELRVLPQRFLTRSQTHAMAQDPELVRAFARYLASEYQAQGHAVSVYADAFLSLNGRPAQRVIDPEFDLAGSSSADFVLARVY